MLGEYLISARLLSIFAAFAVCLALGGCGNQPDVVRVSGTVTYQGKPAPNVFLNFKPTQGRPSWGYTDANGHYELEYKRDVKGALRGQHKVWFNVDKPPPPAGTNAVQASGSQELSQAERKSIKDKHGVEEKALEFDVNEDGQVIDIAID